MSKIKCYDGGYKDIIMSIPTNTIEMTIKLKMYEDGEMFYAKQIFDLNDIKDAEDLFEQCCDGEYPTYTLTEKGEEYVERLGAYGELVDRWERMAKNNQSNNNKKENPVKNVKTTPLPVKETRYGFYKCKGRIKGE